MNPNNSNKDDFFNGFMDHIDTPQSFKNRNREYGNRSPKKNRGRTSPKRTSPKRTSPKRQRYGSDRGRRKSDSSNTKSTRDSFFKNPNPQNRSRGGRHGYDRHDGHRKYSKRGGHAPYSSKHGGMGPNRNQGHYDNRYDRDRKFDRRKFGVKQLNTKSSREKHFKGKKPRKLHHQRSKSSGSEHSNYNKRSSWGNDYRDQDRGGGVRARRYSDKTKDSSKNKNMDVKLYLPPSSLPERPKQRLKQFATEIKMKQSFADAEAHATDILNDEMNYIPPHQRWRIFLTVAEMARRESRFQEARKWFRKAHHENQNEPQIWLEYARMEEECGLLAKSEQVLLEGLESCPYNENLYIKLIRQYEQLNQTDKARKLLGKIRSTLGDELLRVWRVLLEGAVMESRMGRIEEARIAFQYLMENCPQNGSIYYEALRLEQKREDDMTSLRIIQIGLQNARTHAPLWVNAMRIYQKQGQLMDMRLTVHEAVKHVTREIKWKMYYFGAELEADSNCLEKSRELFRQAVDCCPSPLMWKIWLAGARMEVQAGRPGVASKLLERAKKVVPNKYRYIVLLEHAKIEEYKGNLIEARKWTQIAKRESPHEWKVFLESVLLEMRNGAFERAREEAREGLQLHGGTGRLWAMHIRLQYHLGEVEQFKLFKTALRLVPKSGEVWCEGARIRLNPLSSLFSVQMAKKYLTFAIKFTPQFGDNFIEFLRAELLTYGPRIDQEDEMRHLERLCVNAEPNYGPLWFFCRKSQSESSIRVIRRSKSLLITELMKYRGIYQQAILAQNVEGKLRGKIISDLRSKHDYMEFMTGLRSFYTDVVMKRGELNAHQKNVLKQSIFSDTFNI